MKRIAIFIISAALLLGCSVGDVLEIARQGSFAVGGTVLTDSLGRSYHGDHAYVFYQMPVGARRYPLVFAHGVGQFSKTWETTPDGREGFQNIFLRKVYTVYLVDQPRRGNAGHGTETVTIAPAFDEEVWFNRFRIGIWPEYFEGVQFSRDTEALDQFFRQMTPTLGTADFEVYSDAYAALFERIGRLSWSHIRRAGRWGGGPCSRRGISRGLFPTSREAASRFPKGKSLKRAIF